MVCTIIRLSANLAELLGHQIIGMESFARTILNGEDTSRDYLVISQMAHVCQRSVRYQDYL